MLQVPRIYPLIPTSAVSLTRMLLLKRPLSSHKESSMSAISIICPQLPSPDLSLLVGLLTSFPATNRILDRSVLACYSIREIGSKSEHCPFGHDLLVCGLIRPNMGAGTRASNEVGFERSLCSWQGPASRYCTRTGYPRPEFLLSSWEPKTRNMGAGWANV